MWIFGTHTRRAGSGGQWRGRQAISTPDLTGKTIKQHGRLGPKSTFSVATSLPNLLLDVLCPLLPEPERAVLLYAYRHRGDGRRGAPPRAEMGCEGSPSGEPYHLYRSPLATTGATVRETLVHSAGGAGRG